MHIDDISNTPREGLPLFEEACEVARVTPPHAGGPEPKSEQMETFNTLKAELHDFNPSTEDDATTSTIRPHSKCLSEVTIIEPDQCEPFLGAPRAGVPFLDSRDGDLAANVLQHGVVEPIVIWPDGDELRLLSGNRRLAVVVHLRELGHAVPLPARTFDGDAVAALAFAHACNEGRERPTAMEQAKAVAWAIKNLGQPQVEIGRTLGFNEAKVSRLLTLAQLPAFILEAATDANSLSENFAAQLQSDLGDPKKLALMSKRAEKLRGLNVTKAGPSLARYLLTGKDEAGVKEIADRHGKVIARLSSDRHGSIQLKLTPAYLPADADWQGMLQHVVSEINLRIEHERRQQR